ncbi:MAG: hypothetical protein AAGC55_02160, partial [Myxococcota bacterium]
MMLDRVRLPVSLTVGIILIVASLACGPKREPMGMASATETLHQQLIRARDNRDTHVDFQVQLPGY